MKTLIAAAALANWGFGGFTDDPPKPQAARPAAPKTIDVPAIIVVKPAVPTTPPPPARRREARALRGPGSAPVGSAARAQSDGSPDPLAPGRRERASLGARRPRLAPPMGRLSKSLAARLSGPCDGVLAVRDLLVGPLLHPALRVWCGESEVRAPESVRCGVAGVRLRTPVPLARTGVAEYRNSCHPDRHSSTDFQLRTLARSGGSPEGPLSATVAHPIGDPGHALAFSSLLKDPTIEPQTRLLSNRP